MGNKVGNWYQYSGAIHIHTTESDGTRSLVEVVEIGRDAKLDFMMFADHMGLTNRESGLEGMYGKTLVVVGYEHNDLEDNNHFMVFKSPGVYPENMTARQYVAAARADRALGIIAHPIEKRDRGGKYPPYPWTAWDTEEYDGVELWNQMSEWMEKLGTFNKLVMAFSPRKSMVGPPPEVLSIWDRLNLKRRYVGVAGVDAHAFPVDLGPLTVEIFPYKVHFRSLRTHILLDEPMAKDFETAREQLYTAFERCRVFCSNMRWGAADTFQFTAESEGRIATCGDALEFGPNVALKVHAPSRASIRLIHNGRQIAESVSRELNVAAAAPGLYRVEVWKGKRGWIFSNHIRIGV